SMEQDFTAYILGDVNGDWLFNQSAPSYKLVKSKGQNKSTSELLVNGSYEFSIPLSLNQGDSLGSADIWGEFNASALELISIEKAEALTNFHLMYNDTIPGMFKIALFGTKYMKFEDTFITLHFRVITKQIEETTLNWKYFRINNKNYDEDNLIIDTGVNDYSYSGEVVYYQDSIGILDTKLQMLGTVNNQKFSDSEGNYTFTQVSRSDSIVVIPSKERNEDVGNFTISAYDAVLAARHAVGLDTLSGYAWEAADVDTNGIVDMLDAVFIAQQSVGITDTVSSLAGVWRFFPESRTCHYVSENIQNADFTACILNIFGYIVTGT
ncbi:MAG: dockerin type I repeat-containing protein, partial [bacterium]